jgi:hypothetical protein
MNLETHSSVCGIYRDIEMVCLFVIVLHSAACGHGIDIEMIATVLTNPGIFSKNCR